MSGFWRKSVCVFAAGAVAAWGFPDSEHHFWRAVLVCAGCFFLGRLDHWLDP